MYTDRTMSRSIEIQRAHGCRLWIDGVGNWLVWFRDSLIFGNGAELKGEDLRLKIMADLQTRHAKWMRRPDRDVFLPAGPARINGQAVAVETGLNKGDRIELGSGVVIRYDLPSPLSRSAVLRIDSGHRLVDHSDGVVLLNGTCLLGPGEQSHITCGQWDRTLVLFDWEGVLCWKTHQPGAEPRVALDGELIGDEQRRLRVELLA